MSQITTEQITNEMDRLQELHNNDTEHCWRSLRDYLEAEQRMAPKVCWQCGQPLENGRCMWCLGGGDRKEWNDK